MKLLNFTVILLSTFFYLGYLPFPGTAGSLAGIFLFYLIKDNTVIYAVSTLLCILAGLLIAGKAEKIFHKKDAPYIVIDEVAGMLVSLLFIPYDIKAVIIAFILFRILDILKPYPAGRFHRLAGSIGVLSDDIIAGLYANVILQIVLRLASFKIS